jgi:hypothetical protein
MFGPAAQPPDIEEEKTMPADPYDVVFVLAAIAFNLLIAGLFIAQKRKHLKLRTAFGILWLLVALPLVAVFIHYLTAGRDMKTLVSFGFVFLYMFVELLLDYILRIEFRENLVLHVPYIILEYAALFSLIGISFSIDRAWGYVVSICFWILMASLIYLYSDRIWKKAQR